MPTIVPERTIDSLFAFEAISALPTARIFSPANNAGFGTPDHVISVPQGSFVFELKTLSRAGRVGSPWYVDVPRTQLSNYAASAPRTIYVLPAEPSIPSRPWLRKCKVDPDLKGRCKACYASRGSTDAVSRRRWAGSDPRWRAQPPQTQLQPWFSHWAWCLPATSLQAQLSGPPGGSGNAGSWFVPAQDAALQSRPGAIRLCHLLDALSAAGGLTTPYPNGPRPAAPGAGANFASTHMSTGESGSAGNGPRRHPEADGANVVDLGMLVWTEAAEVKLPEGARLTVISPPSEG